MAINFSAGIQVIGRERNEYPKMKEIGLAFDDVCGFWAGPVDFKIEGSKWARCAAECTPSKKDFYCEIADSDSVTAKGVLTPRLNLPKSQKIIEVRYGDVDKDGDIDIAVKLTNGAIYVFHNLSK